MTASHSNVGDLTDINVERKKPDTKNVYLAPDGLLG